MMDLTADLVRIKTELEGQIALYKEQVTLYKELVTLLEMRISVQKLRLECAESACFDIGAIVGVTPDPNKFTGDDLVAKVKEMHDQLEWVKFPPS